MSGVGVPQPADSSASDEIRMGVYQHYKGPLYQVIGLAHDANDETRKCVVYMPLQLDGAHLGPRMAVRTLDDFAAYIDVHPFKRFRYLGPELTQWMLDQSAVSS